MHTLNVKLVGLTCEACVKLSKRRVEKIDGVTQANIKLSGDAEIKSERMISKKEIRDALDGSDYDVL